MISPTAQMPRAESVERAPCMKTGRPSYVGKVRAGINQHHVPAVDNFSINNTLCFHLIRPRATLGSAKSERYSVFDSTLSPKVNSSQRSIHIHENNYRLELENNVMGLCKLINVCKNSQNQACMGTQNKTGLRHRGAEM